MSEPVSPRIPLSRYPGMSRFVLDWLAGDSGATRFLPRETAATPRRHTADPLLVDALIASNRRWGLFVKDQLQRWASEETVTIVAGQQVGFAGGPLYTFAKVATLLAMKRSLEAEGKQVTLFFWLATEDHDFDEVAQLSIPVSAVSPQNPVKRQLDLLTIRARRTVDVRRAVGPLPVPEPLIQEILALDGMPRPQWLREGITFRDSFAELLALVFGAEVVLVDALLPELRRAGAPLLEALRVCFDETQAALRARAVELQESGYTPQVTAREGEPYTLLFALDERGERRIIGPDAPDIAPESLSTSALTRPLLQDLVLGTDIFVGGPAEVSYYAQIAGLQDLHGVSRPRVALRGHVLVAPKRLTRLFDRYGVEPADIFEGADQLLAAREPAGVAAVEKAAREAKRNLLGHIETIADVALPADHALARSIQRSIGHLEYHFAKLTERSIRGLVRKDRERYAAVRELVATLFPDRQVQDRVVGWFPFWRQYGEHMVNRVREEIEPDAEWFRIVAL